jgi:hypothetical protein
VTVQVYSAQDVLHACEGLTYRRLDYWCRNGCFDMNGCQIGSGGRRSFSDGDLLIAQAINRTSLAFEPPTGRIALLPIYRTVAEAVRSKQRKLCIRLGPGIDLHINLNLESPNDQGAREPQ